MQLINNKDSTSNNKARIQIVSGAGANSNYIEPHYYNENNNLSIFSTHDQGYTIIDLIDDGTLKIQLVHGKLEDKRYTWSRENWIYSSPGTLVYLPTTHDTH